MITETEFADNFEKAQSMMYSAGLRILRNPQDAEDNVQDAFMNAWRARDSFRGDCKFTTWLVKIATTCALMKKRNHRDAAYHSVEKPVEEFSFVSGAPDAYRIAAGKQTLERVRHEIEVCSTNALPFLLHKYYEFTDSEIAAALGKSKGGIKAKIWRGRREIKEALEC